MTKWGMANAEQLAELTKTLNRYTCERAGIKDDHPAPERLALRIMGLFNNGIADRDAINRALESSAQDWQAEGL